MDEMPDADTLAWAESALGACRVVSRFAHAHGMSRLWRIAAGDDYVWLKMHGRSRKWAGEVHALTHWADRQMPSVLASRAEPPAVLLTECPGSDAHALMLDGASAQRLWSQAGEWLRAFHRHTNDWIGDVRVDGSPDGVVASEATMLVSKAFEKRIRQARDAELLDAEEVSFASAAFARGLPALAGARAHSIHRDFHPHNWLAFPDGTLAAVIDFEHARWDLLAADLNRPWDEDFRRDPSLIDAFYESYGRPDDRLAAQIQTLRLYSAVVSFGWAIEVGDLDYARFNRDALRRLMVRSDPCT